ncbi:cornifelin homolog B [Danio aesculapii]|uniref:cornifelin homolog B n=1 Tax=Danio aesculapii TaxID=1142201 RepID=UPI0024C0AE80|nr:cornifelin homolog B [Danio aesculapii]
MSNVMVITQPQPMMISAHSSQWGSDICDCCYDVPECCFAFWCFSCYTCIQAKNYGECLCLPLLDMFCGGIIPPITMSIRTSMRQRYGIQGTMCNDCVLSTFCRPCVWCQMSREMKERDLQIALVHTRNI